MAERPLLAMPKPERLKPTASNPPRETVSSADPDRQAIRVGPKFQRLEQVLTDPQILAELRDDPGRDCPGTCPGVRGRE